MEETLAEIDAGSLRTGPELNLADRVVANAVSCAAAAAHSAYEGMMLREALKSGLYDLHIARCEPFLLLRLLLDCTLGGWAQLCLPSLPRRRTRCCRSHVAQKRYRCAG